MRYRDLRRSRRRLSLLMAAASVAASTVACTRDVIEPKQTAPRRVVGVIEVTFTHIGAADMSSSAIVATSMAELEAIHARAARHSGGASFDMTLPSNAGGGGDATIELASLSAGALTIHSVRYLQATYRVRNAQKTDGAAFDTPRRNLTFVAVSTAQTISDTPVLVFTRSDGSAADPSLTRQLIPTGLVAQDLGGNVSGLAPDVLQALTETEVAAIVVPADVTNTFPYGFVVRRTGSATTRTLPASPDPTQFDGTVTFGFRIPLQANPADDPSTISVMMLALDDSEVRTTQSLEEQDANATKNAETRALSLGAQTLTVLPKGVAAIGITAARAICSLRTAGPANAPTATMFPTPNVEPWLLPSPFEKGPLLVSPTIRIAAARCPTSGNADASIFPVTAFQTGQILGAYDPGGSSVVFAPGQTGGFFPGDEVEVTVTTGYGGTVPIVARYRVGGMLPSSGTFGAAVNRPASTEPFGIALGDLNHDGKLDVVVSADAVDSLVVLFGNGDGTFSGQVELPTDRVPSEVQLADVNGDGALDILVANNGASTVTLYLGNGDGTFQPRTTLPVGSRPRSIAVGDYNGDGRLDIAVANQGDGTVSILLNSGGGAFTPGAVLTAGGQPNTIRTADLNKNGKLDLVVANFSTSTSVFLGNGDGTFSSSSIAAPNITGVAVGDLNGDGIPDLVLDRFLNGFDIYIGKGDGTFTKGQSLSAANPSEAVINDFNGDGKLDVAISSAPGGLGVFLGNGDGTLQAVHAFPTAGNAFSLAVGDLNHDAILDVVITNHGVTSVSRLLGVP